MLFDAKIDYTYPEDVDLNPNSATHKKLLDAVNDRIKRGYGTTANMRAMWRKLDHLQTAYVPENEMTIWERKKDEKTAVDVVIPMARACLDISCAYMGGVFLGDPTGLYPLTAHGDKERMVKAAKMEALLNQQAGWFKHKLSHFIGFRDANLYGISVKSPVWTKHKRRDAAIAQVSDVLYQLIKDTVKGISIGDLVRYLEERVYHEGSDILNIDPYALILDPYAKLNRYEEAEFLGYWRRTNVMQLLRKEPDPEERLFNCKYVRILVEKRHGRSTTDWGKETGRHDRISDEGDYEVPGHPGTETTTEVDIATLYWQLIPKEWGLGDREDPELYEIAVAGDEVIVKCNRLDYDHGMFPFVMSGPSTCGYDLLPISGLSATYGMQQFIDWKIRTHWWNASKVQNDMFIVDGSAINIEDFRRPGPGKIIRLKRPLYGEAKIDQFIRQLQVQDVTGNYMADVRNVHDLMNVIMGTQDVVSGNMANMPDRPTATGLSNAQQNAFSRLQMYCQIIQEQEWYTLIRQMAHNNVQFMEHETVVSILGSRFEQQVRDELGIPMGMNEMTVSPWDLDMTTFEIMPMSRLQKETDLSVMSQMMDRMLAIPEIAYEAFGNKDVGRMFDAMVRKMGFANIHEYRKEGGQLPTTMPQAMPDEQVLAQAQAGNLVPVGDAA